MAKTAYEKRYFVTLKGNFKIVQNGNSRESETDKDNVDEDDEEIPEETGTPKIYGTSERDGRYAPIRTNPEKDALQIHNDGEISGESSETNIRR